MLLKFLLLGIILHAGVNAKEDITKHKACASLLGRYSNTLKDFLTCTTEHATPVTICLNCVKDYLNLTDEYETLMTAEFQEGKSIVKCREKYIDQNRLNIVLNTHDYFVNLWKTSACSECFDRNSSVVSNETNTMLEELANLKNCLSASWGHDPCKNCSIVYNKANSYFDQVILKKNKEMICFDIRDEMNRTRLLWSKTLKCCKKEVDFNAFAGVASFVLCLPILFYAFSYFFTKRYERNHFNPLDDNISESSTSSSTVSAHSSNQQAANEDETASTNILNANNDNRLPSTTREAPESVDEIVREKKLLHLD